jgi:general secretion pathway protein H
MKISASAAGFTLIEMLAALLVVSLIAVVAAPSIRRLPERVQLRAEASRMASALRVTRAAAMAQNRAMDFAISAARRSYGSEVIPTSVVDPRLNVEVLSAGTARRANEDIIRFFPNGRSTGGRVKLSSDQASAHVQVLWATGRVAFDD